MLLGEFFRRQLGVGGSGRMNSQRLHVSHIGKKREDMERVYELPCCLFATFYFKGEDATAAVRIVLLVESMVGMGRQRRVVHLLYLRVVSEIVHHHQRVGDMTIYAQREGFKALE